MREVASHYQSAVLPGAKGVQRSNLMMQTPSPLCKLIFVNRFYAPDLSSTSQILTDVCELLADRGHRVVVYSSRTSYDGINTYASREHIKSVEVRRVWSSQLGRGSTVGRSIDYLTFYISITIALVFSVRRGDVVISKTDPPVLSIPLGVIARLRRAKLVNWLQDIFPEVAVELGFGSSSGILINAIKSLRNRSLARAEMNVAIGRKMAETVKAFNVPPERVCVIHNFVDDEAIGQSENHSPELRKRWGFKDTDFIVGYSGNLGRAHDLSTILDAAELLKPSPDIKFLFIGGGHLHETLNREIHARQLSSVSVQPYQPRADLYLSLALPNLHWASLIPSLEGFIVPSKVYGIAAAGRPLLMIGSPKGEIGRLLSSYKFGTCIPAGRSEKIREFILKMQRDHELSETMGNLARAFIDQEASRYNAIQSWDQLIHQLAREA